MSKQFKIKQFSLLYVQFQYQKHFHFKEFSSALARSLNVSTVCQKHFYLKLFSLVEQVYFKQLSLA